MWEESVLFAKRKMGFFVLFDYGFIFLFYILIVIFIFKAILKRIGNRNSYRNNYRNNYENNYGNNYGNTTYMGNAAQGQPDKYRPITSHYSKETLKGVDINSNISSNKSKVRQSPMAGQFIPDGESTNNGQNSNKRYSTNNSQYNQGNKQDQDHNHAYEHKVEPIEEASVHDLFEDRKEAYRERKAQMKADLPKTSYSEVEKRIKSSNGGKYKKVQRNSARNGDNGYAPTRSESAIKCKYCGAINIVPCKRNITYSCYFCREEI